MLRSAISNEKCAYRRQFWRIHTYSPCTHGVSYRLDAPALRVRMTGYAEAIAKVRFCSGWRQSYGNPRFVLQSVWMSALACCHQLTRVKASRPNIAGPLPRLSRSAPISSGVSRLRGAGVISQGVRMNWTFADPKGSGKLPGDNHGRVTGDCIRQVSRRT